MSLTVKSDAEIKDACGANARTVIKRTDFSMGKHVPHVGDEVTPNTSVEAIKE